MAQEQRSSPPKALEWIATNSFLNAVIKTPLRKATAVGISSGTLLYTILSLVPQYQEILSQYQNPETLKLAVSASAVPIAMTVSLTLDYLKKLAGYTNRARQAYLSHKADK